MQFATKYFWCGWGRGLLKTKCLMTIFFNKGRFNIQITKFRRKSRLFACEYLQVHSSKCYTCPSPQGITVCKRGRTPLTEACSKYGSMQKSSWVWHPLTPLRNADYCGTLQTLHNLIAKNHLASSPVSEGTKNFHCNDWSVVFLKMWLWRTASLKIWCEDLICFAWKLLLCLRYYIPIS